MKLVIEKNNDNVLITTAILENREAFNDNVLITTAILENREAFNDNEVVSYLLTSCIKFCREIGLTEQEIDKIMVISNLNYHKHYKE